MTARRRMLLHAALGASIAGCATTAPTSTLRAIELAPGVYVVPGSGGAADERNLGRIGNAGFIIGERGVLVVDTGTSLAHGRELIAAIGAVSRKPIVAALVTHTRPEFLFGGGAFRERGIPIRTHRRTAVLMASRCETCLKTLRQTVGEAPMAGTAMYTPDETFDDSHAIDLGDRSVRVLHFGHSSGPGDIAVLDEASGVLFAGGLLDARRVPDIQDSELPGWKRALQALRDLSIKTVVPGHGPASPPAPLIGSVEGYLAQLETRVRDLVARGVSLLDVADAGDLPNFSAWDQYDTIHRRNTSVAFLRFERELLFK